MVRLESERLIVRQSQPSDVPAIVDYVQKNDEFHRRFQPTKPAETQTVRYWNKKILEVSESEKQDKSLWLLILDKQETEILGTIHYSNIVRGAFHACYLGYMLAEKAEGKGLMTEALTASNEFMFKEKNIHRIMANYLPTNKRSERLLERLGFQKEGLAKEYLLINGVWEDHVLTSLTNSNWSSD